LERVALPQEVAPGLQQVKKASAHVAEPREHDPGGDDPAPVGRAPGTGDEAGGRAPGESDRFVHTLRIFGPAPGRRGGARVLLAGILRQGVPLSQSGYRPSDGFVAALALVYALGALVILPLDLDDSPEAGPPVRR